MGLPAGMGLPKPVGPSKLSNKTPSGDLRAALPDELKQLKAELLAEFRVELNQLKKEILEGGCVTYHAQAAPTDSCCLSMCALQRGLQRFTPRETCTFDRPTDGRRTGGSAPCECFLNCDRGDLL